MEVTEADMCVRQGSGSAVTNRDAEQGQAGAGAMKGPRYAGMGNRVCAMRMRNMTFHDISAGVRGDLRFRRGRRSGCKAEREVRMRQRRKDSAMPKQANKYDPRACGS